MTTLVIIFVATILLLIGTCAWGIYFPNKKVDVVVKLLLISAVTMTITFFSICIFGVIKLLQ